MMYSLKYDEQVFEYDLIRKKKKNLSITVTSNGKIVVSAPEKSKFEDIEKKIYGKISWIYKKLQLVNSVSDISKEKEYVSGESFMYLGKNYRLKIEKNDNAENELKLYKGLFKLKIDLSLKNTENKIKMIISDWYIEKAKEKINERVEIYSKKIRLSPNKISVKNLTKSWGICSSNGNISFNWKIIMTPLSVLDYVIVHELCHLKHHNHSKEFWNLVSLYVPDYKNKKEWLKQNGMNLKI